MLTEFGKICRKIRIESNELMADMASNLGVSTAFLSAVEHGRKKVPDGWVDMISEIYNIDEVTTRKIKNAALESIKQVRINLEDKSDSEKELVVAFARSFEKMTEEDKERLLELLRKE